MPLDVTLARRDTPGSGHVVHLNNAGASLPPTAVTEAVVEHLRLEARIGGYEAAAAAVHDVEGVYGAIAELIGAQVQEVAVLESGTRAWTTALDSTRLQRGDRILTGRAEYGGNMVALLHLAARTGARIEVIEDDQHGQIDVEALRGRIDDDVKLVALTHVPSSGGLVNPAAQVGKVCRDAGVVFLLDACQSVGQLPVDVQAIGCDLLAGTGRKFLRGPRGTGFLYASERVLERLDPPFLDLHAAAWTAVDQFVVRPDARRFESWETSVAGKIGLGVAVEYALSWGVETIEKRVTDLAVALRSQLTDLPGVTVHDRGRRQCAIVTFTVDGVPAAEVQQRLAAAGVNTSVSRAASARLDLAARGLPDLVRASPHYYNDEGDLERLCAALPPPAR